MSPSRDINPLTIEYFTFQDDMIWKLSEKELIDYAEKELRLTGLISKNDEVLDGFIIRSLDAYPVIRKGHQTYVDIIKNFLQSFENITPIGRSGMFKYNNQDHAMATGIYAARNIISPENKIDIWKINSEGIYHESLNIKKLLLKKISKHQSKQKNLTIVIGGDGFMLKTLKKNKKQKNLFYGVNSGNYGFLMNKFSAENIIKNLSRANMISISPLEMIVKNKNNQIKKSLAINEVSILRQSRQTASLSIKQGSKQIIKKLISDGVLVSTPAGSTAYNLSVHGPILSLHSNKLSISPISAFRPRRWKGKIVSDKSKIIIKNLNPNKRPISAVADNIEFRNAKQVIIKTNKNLKFNLLYDKNRSLQKKIKIEQIRRETT